MDKKMNTILREHQVIEATRRANWRNSTRNFEEKEAEWKKSQPVLMHKRLELTKLHHAIKGYSEFLQQLNRNWNRLEQSNKEIDRYNNLRLHRIIEIKQRNWEKTQVQFENLKEEKQKLPKVVEEKRRRVEKYSNCFKTPRPAGVYENLDSKLQLHQKKQTGPSRNLGEEVGELKTLILYYSGEEKKIAEKIHLKMEQNERKMEELNKIAASALAENQTLTRENSELTNQQLEMNNTLLTAQEEHENTMQYVKALQQQVEQLQFTNSEVQRKAQQTKVKNKMLLKENNNFKKSLRVLEARERKVKEVLYLTRKLKYVPLKEFKVLKVLGQGANGIVFLVEITLPKDDPRQFALKMILNFGDETELSDEIRSQYSNEFEVLRNITDIHPNIIHILSEFVTRPTGKMIDFVNGSLQQYLIKTDPITGEKTPIKTQFFLTENCPGTLDDLMKREKEFTVKKIYAYSRELLDCFAFLFQNEVVHRDVKPNNILVSVTGELILTDFGESVETENHICSKERLRTGNQKYQAPEVLNSISPHSKKDKIDFSGQY